MTQQTDSALNVGAIESLTIDGKVFRFEDFALGDLEEFEEAMGGTLDTINPKSMRASLWLVYLARHSEDASYTLDQARAEKLSVLIEPNVEDSEASDPPTKPAAKRKGKAA